jgi:transposase InsO family protein
MTEKDQRWALFWCGLLHPVLFGEVPKGQRSALLRRISQTDVVYPDGTKRKPPLSTLKRKLRTYELEGFEGLARKGRSDRAKPRAHPQQLIDKAIELKKDLPTRSAHKINKFLKIQFGKTIPASSLYRYLAQAGATKAKLGVAKKPIRCRWTREHTHDLWIGDYADGPFVLEGDDFAQSHLCVFIDCHSRYCIGGRYYLSETFDTLIDTCLAAWDIHGAPLQIYLDNARVFVSDKLRSACYALHIQILHRPVGDPAPGGLIERFIQTVQGQFESEVRAGSSLSLSELNRAFSAWLDVSYHQRLHSQTTQTPEERYHQGSKAFRKVDLASVMPYFMEKLRRKVHPDFSDVQLHKMFFKVDPKLRGDAVTVHFDPYGDMQSVLIYSLDGQYLGKGVRHDRERATPLPPSPSSGKAQHHILDEFIRIHDEALKTQAKGIDYSKVPKALPFHELAKTLARLLGFQGGVTGLSQRQLHLIHRTHLESPHITKTLVKRAFEQTHDPSLMAVLYTLKTLAKRQQRKDL